MIGTDRRILDFEQKWWRNAGAKADAIATEFGLSETRYYQKLNRLLDDPSAVEYAPQLVNRLRRIRSARSDRRNHQP
jgi:hypothetical protein